MKFDRAEAERLTEFLDDPERSRWATIGSRDLANQLRAALAEIDAMRPVVLAALDIHRAEPFRVPLRSAVDAYRARKP